jgi:O-antigen/teichoic acid export membrane protein
MLRFKDIVLKKLYSDIVKNSIYGLIANILQIIFTSLLFIIIVRSYQTDDFAKFLLATTVYQLIVAFSTMGLGQWFIREFTIETDKQRLINKYFKIQIGLGFFFYVVNICFASVLYTDSTIRLLSILLGTNIVFDNIILAIKSLNVAEYKQNRTAIILVIDGILKMLIGCLLFVFPISIVVLSCLLIAARFVTLNLFLRVGVSHNINLIILLQSHVLFVDIKNLIFSNWRFIVIGSISIIYWRLANIIISKVLTLHDVADYEISFRLFSVMIMIPIIASTTIFPKFVEYFNSGDYIQIRRLYNKLFVFYNAYALIGYTFIYSFSAILLPFLFGKEYSTSILCVKEMFLTSLILPTVLLQANLIIAMKLENLDMQFNLISLVIYITGCFVGLYFFKSLTVINYSIFVSFIAFHIFQDILLIKRKITTISKSFTFYLIFTIIVLIYQYASKFFNSYILFFFFNFVLLTIGFIFIKKQKESLNII